MADDQLVASTLDDETICRHLHLVSKYIDKGEIAYLHSIQRSAINYICDHCAVTPEYVDEHEDLAIATLILIADMYDQRTRYVDKGYENRTVTYLLSHHDRNFIGPLGGDDDADE